MTTNLTVKKASSITKRSLDSFRLFQSKEFVSGYQNLVTIQPLNKSKTRGWFIRKSIWTPAIGLPRKLTSTKAPSFGITSKLWFRTQQSIEEGLNFITPRLQIYCVHR